MQAAARQAALSKDYENLGACYDALHKHFDLNKVDSMAHWQFAFLLAVKVGPSSRDGSIQPYHNLKMLKPKLVWIM